MCAAAMLGIMRLFSVRNMACFRKKKESVKEQNPPAAAAAAAPGGRIEAVEAGGCAVPLLPLAVPPLRVIR
jgi:hypothetical protein